MPGGPQAKYGPARLIGRVSRLDFGPSVLVGGIQAQAARLKAAERTLMQAGGEGGEKVERAPVRLQHQGVQGRAERGLGGAKILRVPAPLVVAILGAPSLGT